MLVLHKLIFGSRKYLPVLSYFFFYVSLLNVLSFAKHVSSFVTYIPFLSVHLVKRPADNGNEFVLLCLLVWNMLNSTLIGYTQSVYFLL
jgi:hypothetical protein